MCGSRRRRPITSPPGGGTIARPKRASSGPASRNEARMRRQSSSSSSVLCTPAGSIRISFSPSHSDFGADVDEQLDHRLDVADPRHVRQLHGLGGEHAGGEDRQRAVLVPGGADGAAQRAPALDHEGLHTGGERSDAHEAGYRRRPMERNAREGMGDAHDATRRASRCSAMPSPSRPRRGRTRAGSARTRSCGASSRSCTTSTTRSIPTLDQHPQDGAPILRDEGYPDEVIEAVLSHAEHLELPRDTHAEEDALRLRRALRVRARLRARPPDRPRRARAEVGEEEAEAAVLRGRRPPRRGLRGRGADRGRAGRAHRERRRRAAADLTRARAADRGRRGRSNTAVTRRRRAAARSSSFVHQPHETRTRPVSGISRTTTPASASRATSAGGSSRRNATSVAPPGTTSTLRLEQLAAARGQLGGALERASRAAARARSRSPASPALESPAGIEAGRALGGLEAAGRLVRGLREVARPSDAQALRIGDDERARRVRAAEPLLAGDRQEVETRPRRPGSRRPTARRRRGSARPSARAARGPAGRGRSSRAPARARAGASAASPRPAIASGSGSATTTRAPLACSGPSRPKCSSDVVTISSSGLRSSPASTMLQPSVVEPVSDTCSGSTPTRLPRAARARVAQLEHRARSTPCRSGRARGRRRAAPAPPPRSGGRAGRTCPAFRYATRSSTGKSARASSGVIRS